MNHLLNLGKAFGIVLAWYLLLVGGVWAMIALRFGNVGTRYLGLDDVAPTDFSEAIGLILVFFVLPYSMAFGSLYLPPKGRLCAAMGALSLLVALSVYVGFRLFTMPDLDFLPPDDAPPPPTNDTSLPPHHSFR